MATINVKKVSKGYNYPQFFYFNLIGWFASACKFSILTGLPTLTEPAPVPEKYLMCFDIKFKFFP